eukprot:1700939-Ditylum_brightwellii.AAC.1
MPNSLTESLSDVVYKKTGGNVLFVIQFLNSICDEELLFYSFDDKGWKWDVDAIEAKEIPDEVGALLSRKIRQLPIGCQHSIKILACIGSKCDESILIPLMCQGS